MGLFDINYGTLVSDLLPVRLRGNKMNAFLNALVAPVVYLYGLFYTNRTNNLYYLRHTSQLCYMQGALNDLFDPVNREITIIDGPDFLPIYIYLQAELTPQYIVTPAHGETFNGQWLYTAAETISEGYDFIVQVPAAISTQPGYSTPRIKALVDEYRLAGKFNYLIQTV